MKYRKFGPLDWEVSALGFGVMRLPVMEDDSTRINELEALAMIRHAIDQGVNYLDTAFGYHHQQSEGLVGKALKDGYRTKVKVATKLPCWLVNTTSDFDLYLEKQMKRLDVDEIDFYLLHSLNQLDWQKMKDLGVLAWAEKRMAEGLFKYLGFSFHDVYSAFEDIVNGYDNWTLAQIQYNYMDVDYQAGKKGLHLASDRGLAVVVMEPLRGGRIAKNPPPASVEKVLAKSERKWSPAEWAFHWLWDQPEVATTLSGMSAMAQVEENLAAAAESAVGLLTTEDHALIEEVRDAYSSLAPIPCTQCEYCLPCPNGVAIPRIFSVYNDAVSYDAWEHAKWVYNNQVKPEEMANMCIECGECEAVCPQHIEIIEWLAKVHDALAEPAE